MPHRCYHLLVTGRISPQKRREYRSGFREGKGIE